MKNNLYKGKCHIFKDLSVKENINYGYKLKQLRNLLVLKPEDISSVLTISTNTIKKAEEGGNVGIEVIGELCLFYGYTLEKFYSLKSLPTWENLKQQMVEFHIKNKSIIYKKIFDRPSLQDLIEFRLLKTNLFEDWVNESQVIDFCKNKYNYNYSSATNTLNNCVLKGWLIIDKNSKPRKYKLKNK